MGITDAKFALTALSLMKDMAWQVLALNAVVGVRTQIK